jgi:hypothetical protein
VCEKGLTEFPESHASDLDSPPSKRVSFVFHQYFAVSSAMEGGFLQKCRWICQFLLTSAPFCPAPTEASGGIKSAIRDNERLGRDPLRSVLLLVLLVDFQIKRDVLAAVKTRNRAGR